MSSYAITQLLILPIIEVGLGETSVKVQLIEVCMLVCNRKLNVSRPGISKEGGQHSQLLHYDHNHFISAQCS